MSNSISSGGRNLVILGIVSIIISIATCGVSLYLYHDSGDIYLDRSRPGFLPEQNEESREPEESYTIEDSGPITDDVINEYIEHLRGEMDRLNSIEKPFSPDPLSDESLGIPDKPKK